MVDKTVLELVDRLVAENARRIKAEAEIEATKEDMKLVTEALNNAEAEIGKLKTRISELEAEVETKKESVIFWANRADGFEKELKAIKGKHEENA